MQNSQNTFSKEDYLKKAKQILEVALFLYEHRFYNDSFSRLYYALRSLFRGLCGKPPKGKWRHEALFNCFLHKFDKNTLSLEEKKLLRKMPSIRNDIDYDPVEIEKKKLDIYISIAKKIFKEFTNDN